MYGFGQGRMGMDNAGNILGAAACGYWKYARFICVSGVFQLVFGIAEPDDLEPGIDYPGHPGLSRRGVRLPANSAWVMACRLRKRLI